VKRLRAFARADRDPGRRAQLVLTKNPVEHPEHDIMDGQGVERPGLAEEAVDPTGAVALEVAPPDRCLLHDGFKFGPGPGHLLGTDGAGDGGVAVLRQGGHDVLDHRLSFSSWCPPAQSRQWASPDCP
jgi:hypothetical protein